MDMNQALSLTPSLLGTTQSMTPEDRQKEPNPPPVREFFSDIDGNEVTTYEVGPDGHVDQHVGSSIPTSHTGGVMGNLEKYIHVLTDNKAANYVKKFIVPDNMETGVSKDYPKVRAWSFLQSMAWNAANYASGAALAIALGLNPLWGGAAMATFNLIKDKVSLGIGFAATKAVPPIDRNPRPWMIAGEALDHAGIMTETMTALTAGIPGALLPIGLAGCVLRTISGNVKGPSWSNVEPRQALAGNLSDVQKKNGNQGVISNIIGSAVGLYAVKYLIAAGFGALSPAIVAGAGAALAIVSTVATVKSMDYHPVNEKALRRVIDSLETDKKVVGPDTSLWGTISSIWKRDTVSMGDTKMHPTPENVPHLRELKKVYTGRNYILDVKDGESTIYLNKGCTPQDRILATIQGIHVERLREGDEYKAVLSEKGTEGADRWLMEASLKKTPRDPAPLLKDMQKAGWSVDVLKAKDDGLRSTWSGGPDESGLQYELDLPAPPPKPGTGEKKEAAS
jgi:hypothetical protein